MPKINFNNGVEMHTPTGYVRDVLAGIVALIASVSKSEVSEKTEIVMQNEYIKCTIAKHYRSERWYIKSVKYLRFQK